jgi:peptide/nickel transport system substrate-binding protein/oligopeptide transport system substrate-binding protein
MKSIKSILGIFFLLSCISILPSEALGPRIIREGENPISGGTYRRPLEFMPKTLDPALAADIYSVTIIQQLFDGLVQFDQNLNVIPAIAKSWKISHDGLTYTFFLREGVRFHNGREVTADDFVYSFSRIINPKIKSPADHFLEKVLGFKEFQAGKTNDIAGLKSAGKYIFEIKLSEPFYPFVSVLGVTNLKVIPKEEVEKPISISPKSPIGTGSFKFTLTKEGEEVVLEANPDYFEGRPYLDKIIFKIFHGTPYEDIFRNFVDCKLEESAGIPFKEFRDPDKMKNFYIVRKPILSLRFYGMEVKTKPFDNKMIRQAINFAIDKEQIDQEAFQGMDHLTDRILPVGMPGSSPVQHFYPYNLKRAKDLLSQAGYPGGKGIPPIAFWSASRADVTRKELEIVKSNLARIGMDFQIHTETNWKKFEEMMSSYKTPMFRYAWYADFPDPDNFLGILFHSKSQCNYMAYFNPNVDRLLDTARVERDYLQRMGTYRKLEEIIMEEAPIVPTINHIFQQAYQSYVRGIEVNALGGPYIPMKKIWLKK